MGVPNVCAGRANFFKTFNNSFQKGKVFLYGVSDDTLPNKSFTALLFNTEKTQQMITQCSNFTPLYLAGMSREPKI